MTTKQECYRESVDFRYDALPPEFLHCLAELAHHAGQVHNGITNYLDGRLIGGKGPINHALSHIGNYRCGANYDYFDHKMEWHLVAAAYNLMMEWVYIKQGYPPDVWPPKE